MAKSSASVAKKWAQNFGAAGQSVREGVMGVQVSPTQKAAAAQDAYVQGVQNAASSGKWARGLNRVSLSDWQNAVISKGIPIMSDRATKALPKFSAFLDSWLPYMEQLKSKLASMPRGTKGSETNKQRMVAAFEHNKAYVRQ